MLWLRIVLGRERMGNAVALTAYPVIVGFDEEIIALLCGEILFDDLACLIIHHIHFNFMSLELKKFKLLLIGGKDCVVGKISNW